MTIEERVAGAMADLEGLLAEGADPETAISEAASLYELKAEVVATRAAKEFGDLEEVRQRYVRLKVESDRDRRLKSLVRDYVERFFGDHPNSALPFVPINAWIKREFGDDARSRDLAFATARVQMAFHRKMLKEIQSSRSNEGGRSA